MAPDTESGRNSRLLRRKVLQYRELQAMKGFYFRRKMHRGEAAGDWNPPIEGYFRQPLDHFNRQNNATYNQRYWINEEFWQRPQGPVFLYIGGESSLSQFSVLAGEHVDLAQSHGALLVALEHRYYGGSINPDGLTNEGIRFLSSQQALADLASFHRFLSEKYSLTRNNTWICFGGSYPGSLSAWFRLKFPHLVFAAVASSAPVRAELDFVGYNKVVAESLSNPVVGGSSKCLDAVVDSFHTVDGMLQAGRTSQLEKDFCSCQALQGSEDYGEFASNLADIFMGTVQYNGEMPGRDIRAVCDIMTNASLGSSYSRLMAINQQYMQSMSQTCVQNSYQKSLDALRNSTLSMVGVGERQWIFQTCTEFGYYQTCEGGSCPFSRLITLHSELDLCLQLFGISAESVQEAVLFTNEYYGADRPKASRVLFVNGDIDPWHALSVLHNQSHSELAIYINGTAHCANMVSSKPLDPPALRQAREEIAQHIGEWLEAAKRQHLDN
ncbi:thymus-specific serine protease-like isoform X2 [Rhinatrema bivittatum]|uniref:thymus-specific serine protease-like isoform X2 n=1 Tax=Rhinatrema bivittatum TaxID=194408 RepID=UPI00112885B7|nr:thymus-specific serine protease-like isoform X2 [Rhinatrema bivittatum]